MPVEYPKDLTLALSLMAQHQYLIEQMVELQRKMIQAIEDAKSDFEYQQLEKELQQCSTK